MGSGSDELEGFGSFIGVGGSGRDVWDLSDYSMKEFKIKKPVGPSTNSAEFFRAATGMLPDATALIS
jgi:hypothetical protein